jgi:hypothetical protein
VQQASKQASKERSLERRHNYMTATKGFTLLLSENLLPPLVAETSLQGRREELRLFQRQ